MKGALLLLLLFGSAAEARDPNLIGARVKSGSWRILRQAHEVEIFEGDVRYIKPDRVIRADYAKFDHDTEILEARGDVRARQRFRGDLWLEAAGHRASHDRKSGDGELLPKAETGRVFFKLIGPLESGEGSAAVLRWNQKKETVLLDGDVNFEEARGTLRAERADYRHADRTLTLTGRRPVVTGREPGWASAVQADKITATDLGFGRRRVTGTGRARGWIVFDGPDRRQYH